MPLTPFQQILLRTISPNRSPSSFLAGGTALHFAPNSTRFSHDVDLFHDDAEQVKRRGRYRPEDFARLDLVKPIDLVETRVSWQQALSEADRFIDSRPPQEAGCLYYST